MGYDKLLWAAAPEESSRGQAVRLTYTSADGEEASWPLGWGRRGRGC